MQGNTYAFMLGKDTNMKSHLGIAAAAVALGIAAFQGTANAQQTLREKSQNPIADLISVPFQNNTNFGVGQLNKTQNIHNIQPVIPIQLNENWNLITRTIVPVTYQPALFRGDSTDFGLGDATPQLFFSPRKPAPFMGNWSGAWDLTSC